MSAMLWNSKLSEAQDVATRATKAELGKRYTEAFQLYLRAGQLYLWLLSNFPVESSAENGGLSKQRLKQTTQKVMARAEKIKASGHDLRPVERDRLSDEEQAMILARSASINQLTFPAWSGAHEASASTSTSTQTQPLLAPAQLNQGAVYKRFRPSSSSDRLGLKQKLRGSDIVQDTVTDCSFVAALEVVVEHDYRFGTTLASSALYPCIHKTSDEQRYNVRLLINGIPRCVTIDDQLPCYPSEAGNSKQLMCATVRDGQVIWPALLEKAYLKVMGGYDFLGSNSSIDLHALTGWIPEQLFLQQAGFQRERAWSRVFGAWTEGDVLISVGTGKSSARLEGTGLVSRHDYAVLALIENGNRRYARLMNPWKSAHNDRPAVAISQKEQLTLQTLDEQVSNLDVQEAGTGTDPTFVVTWDDLCSYFDSLYLNWNPLLFKHSLAVHSSWRLSDPSGAIRKSSVGQNPQYRLRFPDGLVKKDTRADEIWLLLTRHYPSHKVNKAQEEYIAIHVFQQDSAGTGSSQYRLYSSNGVGGRRMGAYVDGTHNLVRFKPAASTIAASQSSVELTVVVSRHADPAHSSDATNDEDVNFTLNVYSPYHTQIHELPRAFPYRQSIDGEWTQRTAGGSVTNPTFLHNPQWSLTLPRSKSKDGVSLLFVLECAKHIPAQLVLVYPRKGAGRISSLSEGDIVASSGIYNHGMAVAQRNHLDTSASAAEDTGAEATYTLIASTFDPATVGEFHLAVEASVPATLRPIAPEGAGMFRRTLSGKWHAGMTAGGSPSHPSKYLTNPSWIVSVPPMSGVTTILGRLTLTVVPSPRPYINLALFGSDEQGGLGVEIASSGPYTDMVCGALLDTPTFPTSHHQKQGQVLLQPGKQYRLIASAYKSDVEASFSIEFYSQKPVDIRPISSLS